MNSKGYTLIELLVVIAVLVIIVFISVPIISKLINHAQESVCINNLKTIERTYLIFLYDSDTDHEDSIFNQYLIENYKDVCIDVCLITYNEGKVICSEYDYEEQSNEESPNDEVPWLNNLVDV